MMTHARGALEADFMRVYHATPNDFPPTQAARLSRFLPDGSHVWQELDTPNAWTRQDYLLASILDGLNVWLWANSDPNKRGPRPQPVTRPGRTQETTPPQARAKHIRPMALPLSELDKILNP